MLEANGFIVFAEGADSGEVCKKWQLPPPPPTSSPHPSDPARVGVSPVALVAQPDDTKSVAKQQPVNQSSPTKETDSKPILEDGLESAASPATQAAPLSDDQRSWQTDIESTLVDNTKQVFAAEQVLPITFHVLPGSSRSSVEAMIVVSLTINFGRRTDQTASRRRCNRTSKSSFYPCRSHSLQRIRSMDNHRRISSYGTAWMGSRVSSDRQIGKFPELRGEE